jgi:beta-lactamase class A
MPMQRRAFMAGGLTMLAAGESILARPVLAQPASLPAPIDAIAGTFPGEVGIYVRTMDDAPPRVALRADEHFASASVIKVLIMVTAYRAFERDPALRTTTVRLRASDRIGGSPVLAHARGGERFTLLELVRAMIVASDNTAANALITFFGFGPINATAARFGLERTRLGRHFADEVPSWRASGNITTPRDMGELLYLIERGSREAIPTVASPAICREMIEVLLRQRYRGMIPAGLPPSVSVADKVGEVTGVRNDVAIVEPFGDVPYVIAVLSRNVVDYERAIRGINAISRAVYARFGIATG